MSYVNTEFKLLELLAPIESDTIQVDMIKDYLRQDSLSIGLFINLANRVHRILPTVFYNIQYIRSKFQLKYSFLDNCAEKIGRTMPEVNDRDKNIALLEQCITYITQAQKNVIFLKGVPLQTLYLTYTKTYRQMRDVDILFCRADSIFKFATLWLANHLIINECWQLNILPILFAQNGLAKISSNHINFANIHLDNKVSSFFIKKIDAKYAKHLFLPTDVLFANKINLCMQNVEFWSASLEHTAYILIAHIAEHGFLRLLWINDLYLLITKTSLDWDWVLATLSKDGLLPMFCSILEYTERIYRNSHIIAYFCKAYPKYFTKLRKASAFRYLCNNNPAKPSAINIFLIQIEKIQNRVKHRVTFFILFAYLLFRMLWRYFPKELKIIQKRIVRLIVIPLKMRLRMPIALPQFYTVNILRTDLSKTKTADIIINWDRTNGFKLKCSSIELGES
ncbi:MAG: nucleotidyltransferase family protein [candidate division WOR-3 bacterium]